MFSKILFPVDFSKRCVGVAHAVRAMAMQFRAEVTALHVIEVASANSVYESLVRKPASKWTNSSPRNSVAAWWFLISREVIRGKLSSVMRATGILT